MSDLTHLLRVYTTYKGYGSIRKEPEIYILPLKKAPIVGVDRKMDAVMELYSTETNTIEEDGVWTPRLQGKNVH